ncbi:MAG: RNA-guided endonuclease TnpB family protein [Aestuariivita sp.]|nr:RNA-guided endonuclease TnpB family protein [Aestuariivita sp.]MCY4202295.1 RNA-guided endonuclease TnpB family protein [Aestuariivita sp.]
MLLAHKIQLYPTSEQADYINRACGARRHAFNQLLAHFKQDGVKWSKKAATEYFMLHIRPAFPWYSEVSARVTRNAIQDLDSAFDHFFRRVKQGKNPGFPRFKRKGKSNESFSLREKPKFSVESRKLRIERCPGLIRMRQKLRFTGTLCQVTISTRAGKYYASVLIDTQDYNTKDASRQSSAIGVDMGIKELAVLSNGERVPANQKLKANLRRLARRNRRLSRKQKGSNRMAKAKLSLARLHQRIADQRHAVLHELSDDLTRRFDTVVIEDLNVSGMVQNRRLARAISDAGFGALKQYLQYKAELRGCTILKANRFYPSSKTCSACGAINQELGLKDRDWTCAECGADHDRDLNAAINLREYGRHTLAAVPKRTQEDGKTAAQAPARLVTV